ncbi:diacylglycerol/lipid kinase family protein [Nocardioides sambongensis]|uniref:diacylglycerol/lipid kinase family protein n=1 Tax=Nocardioides sambongensis TaxID=2589074 RepID=UPI00112BCEAA|nr:diacylglycerol kinase family protein [Nocardioides sambongensis]
MTAPARSFCFLVNPVAGGGAGPRVVVPLARALREAGSDVEVRYTSTADEVPELVAAAVARGAVVVSVGGDGMLSSVAGPVADAGGVLGVVPAGRGNDFARELGTPMESAALVELLRVGRPRAVDLLEVTDATGTRAVAGSVYTGVDARAAAIVDRSRWLPTRLQYPVAAVAALATYRPVDIRVELDGVVSEHRAATVVVANSGYYGKGMRIAPLAAVDDGELDVVVIEAAGRAALVRALPQVYDGRHVDLDEVHVLRGSRVRLSGTLSGGASAPVGADGEPLADLARAGVPPLEVAIRPGALRVLG